MIGVSPAYFISRYSELFTPKQIAECLEELHEIGFEAFELEVFHVESLRDWEKLGARLVSDAASTSGLTVSQFVAHFMLHAFESPEAIRSDFGLDETDRVIGVLSHFPSCPVVTIPLGGFRFDDRSEANSRGVLDYPGLYKRFLEKLRKIVAKLEQTGRRCAIELMPGALVNGSDGLLKLFQDLGSKTVGYNFDTGHAHSSKENVALIPHKLRGRLLGTHLCDNHQNENLSLRPGAGSIEWSQVFEALRRTEYTGSLDIEIRCDEQQVGFEYRTALEFLRSNWQGGEQSAVRGEAHEPTTS